MVFIMTAGHWERAFCATEASLEQLAVFQQILQEVVPRMQQLESEREELAACINSVKALTLHEQSMHAKAATRQLQQQQQEQQRQQQQKQEKEQQLGRIGASRAAGLRKAAVQRVAAATAAAAAAAAAAGCVRIKAEQPDAFAAEANGWHNGYTAGCTAVKQETAEAAGYYTSLLQQALSPALPAASSAAAEAAVAMNGVSEGSDTNHRSSSRNNSTSSCSESAAISTSALRYLQGTCKDMVADMDLRLLKWRTLSGARSAVTFVLRSEQLAAMLLAAFPYLPMMACMCDYVPAAREAALQRQQQQQQR
jgi:hypothetical protein